MLATAPTSTPATTLGPDTLGISTLIRGECDIMSEIVIDFQKLDFVTDISKVPSDKLVMTTVLTGLLGMLILKAP